MMPPQCKQHESQSPPYDYYDGAYGNRRDIECNVDHIQLLWNCTYIERPLTNIGILALESRNAILNQYNWRLYHQSFIRGYLKGFIFVLNNNRLAFKYWREETAKPLEHRKQPGLKTHIDDYPNISAQIGRLIDGLMDFSLMRNSFYYKSTKRMIPIIYLDIKELQDMAYQQICKHDLVFSGDGKSEWTNNHYAHLWTQCKKNNIIRINNKYLKELSERLFEDRFPLPILFQKCKDIGLQWV